MTPQDIVIGQNHVEYLKRIRDFFKAQSTVVEKRIEESEPAEDTTKLEDLQDDLDQLVDDVKELITATKRVLR